MNRDENPINGRQRAVVETVRWPFERALWLIQRGVLWPLQDRLALLGPAGRATAGVAAGVLALAAAAIGIGIAGGSEGTATSGPVAQAPANAPAAEQVADPEEPTLEGASPVFRPKAEKSPPKTAPAKSSDTGGAAAEPTGSASAATDTISSSPAAESATASSSTARRDQVDGPPAGPKALAVARGFAGAFVVYETGGEKSKVRKTFTKTATRELTRSLLRRPPRLPENVEVPKAKVVNVVAGPSHDGIYPVSVSLLRVGLTSELRLDMEQVKGKGWRVTNVLG